MGLLKITEDNVSNRSTELAISKTKEILTVPIPVVYNENVQVSMPRSIVSDPEWFDGDWMKFEDWWREIWLSLKSNRIVATDDKIITVLPWLRGGIAGIYMQKKINKLEYIEDSQDWEEFVKEIKTAFNNKSKIADTK